MNLSTQLATHGPALGLLPAQVAAAQAACTAQIACIDATVAAEAGLQARLEAEADQRKRTDATLREQLGDWKRLPGWTAETAAALQAVSITPSFTADAYKPAYKVRIVGGEIRLDWKKKGVDAMYIYSRLRGQAEWVRIAVSTAASFVDQRPLAHAGVAETREYLLRGAIHDQAIGLDSDILSIAWGGA